VIIIIGAGIAGLAAAHELTNRRMPFVLLEAAERTGGLIRTDSVNGFTIDAGPDSILVQKPAALQLCEELGLTSRLMSTTPPRTAFVLKAGRLYPLPSPSVLGIPTGLSALATYRLLGVGARARIAVEPLIARRDAADESIASFFRRRFGRASVDLIADPLLGGIHAGDITKLSMPSVFPQLASAERKPGGVIRNVRRREPAGDGLFRALRGGMGEIISAIEARLPPGSLHTRAPVRR
jgi:protoporphyrinogen/coproporphyrinogen III oxidase